MDVAVHANGAGSPSTIGDTTITPTTAPATIGATSAFVPLASPRRLLDTRAASQTGYSGGNRLLQPRLRCKFSGGRVSRQQMCLQLY